MNKLNGKAAVITGANQGLGLEISKEFLKEGASIVMCARGTEKLRKVREDLLPLADENQKILAFSADVSSQASINAFIEHVFSNFEQIHILVNNAGVYGPMGSIEDVDWDEWVQAITINLFGSVIMCRALLPHFKNHHYGKIIQLSGGGATNPLPRISAYAASKAAVIRFAESLAEEVRGTGIYVNAIAPGPLNTRLLDQVLEAGREKVGADFYERSLKQKVEGGASMEKAARLAVFLASEESNGISGKLISAVWDPWESFPEHLEELKSTDIYTLRRITLSDRGLKWNGNE